MVTFAERPEDLIANVESFGWDLGGLVRDGHLAIVDATPDTELLVSGRFDLGGLTARIAHALSEVNGTRLFMDPIDALFEEFSDVAEVRRAFAAMLRALRPLGATALISAERPSEDGSITRYGAEEFAVDNVIVMRNVREEERRRRTIEVLKLRGADHHRGEFPFVINAITGVEIVPFSPIEGDDSGSPERISLGNADLDAMCGGGMYRDALMMITGATGTGKTLIGLQFMVAGIKAGERVLYLSFEESRWQLERNAAAWGMDLTSSEHAGQSRDRLALPRPRRARGPACRAQAHGRGSHPKRLVLDSITAVEHNAPQNAFREFSVGLSGFLKARGVATMMTTTLPDLLGGDARHRPVSLDDRGRDHRAALLRSRQPGQARNPCAEGPRIPARERDARVRDPRHRHVGQGADSGDWRNPGRHGADVSLLQRRRHGLRTVRSERNASERAGEGRRRLRDPPRQPARGDRPRRRHPAGQPGRRAPSRQARDESARHDVRRSTGVSVVARAATIKVCHFRGHHSASAWVIASLPACAESGHVRRIGQIIGTAGERSRRAWSVRAHRAYPS